MGSVLGWLVAQTVFNFTVYNWEISWEIRYLVSDLLPQMVRMMEPLERLCAVLGAVPRIEPHPDKQARTHSVGKYQSCMF